MIVYDPRSPVPPYEQVRAQLARQVQAGELAPGTRLPTVRRLAADLGLAVNTVARAYRELERDGLVATRGRNGTVVARGNDEGLAAARDAAAEYADRVRRLGLPADRAVELVRSVLDASEPEPRPAG
jgi:DNA-binding transcriptional regulator YhcF (GntR family)